MVRPSQRKEVAKKAALAHGASIRLVCLAFGISETCYRYQPILSDENAEIADWLIRLTHNQKDWGFGLCRDSNSVGFGGIYEGWAIATEAVADEFSAAALGLTSIPCNDICGNVIGYRDGDFGNSHDPIRYDFFASLDGINVGLYRLDSVNNGQLFKSSPWGTIALLDSFGSTDARLLICVQN